MKIDQQNLINQIIFAYFLISYIDRMKCFEFQDTCNQSPVGKFHTLEPYLQEIGSKMEADRKYTDETIKWSYHQIKRCYRNNTGTDGKIFKIFPHKIYNLTAIFRYYIGSKACDGAIENLKNRSVFQVIKKSLKMLIGLGGKN